MHVYNCTNMHYEKKNPYKSLSWNSVLNVSTLEFHSSCTPVMSGKNSKKYQLPFASVTHWSFEVVVPDEKEGVVVALAFLLFLILRITSRKSKTGFLHLPFFLPFRSTLNGFESDGTLIFWGSKLLLLLVCEQKRICKSLLVFFFWGGEDGVIIEFLIN